MNQPLEADRRVAAVIESSVVFGALDRSLALVWRAVRGSAVAARVIAMVTTWRGAAMRPRRRAIGTALVAAVVTHLLLTLATQVPPGWLWLIVPGLTAAIGGLVIAASGAART